MSSSGNSQHATGSVSSFGLGSGSGSVSGSGLRVGSGFKLLVQVLVQDLVQVHVLGYNIGLMHGSIKTEPARFKSKV